MPGIELVTKFEPSTKRAKNPRWRTAIQANGKASTVVSAAAPAASATVCIVDGTISPSTHTSLPPIHSHRTIVHTGTPSDSTAKAASAASAGSVMPPRRWDSDVRCAPDPRRA
jgi:hypothetical protein